MYANSEFRSVEKICYEEDHIKKVVETIEQNLPEWFDKFLKTSNGIITFDGFKLLQEKFGVSAVKGLNSKDLSKSYKEIIKDSINEFEKDRQDYLNILDLDNLEEYEDDLPSFKSEILRNKCPIIRKTIQNRAAKELEKYRKEFSKADAAYLHKVVKNLTSEAERYISEYIPDEYESADSYKDLKTSVFDSDDCTAYGVIGGGIKSLMLHKLYPQVFSSRSRMALWALWYLSEKRVSDAKRIPSS